MRKKIKQYIYDVWNRSRAGAWAPFATVGLTGYLLGIASLPLFNKITLDSGLATLFGSAFGAAITVVGSIWVARYQMAARERSFGKFVADASTAIRDEAYVLIALLEINNWDNNERHAAKIKKEVEYLKEAIALFQKNAPFSDIGNYDARLWISRLEEIIQNNMRILDKELQWLNHPTTQVLQNSRGDLNMAAQAIFEGCVHVCRELHHRRELPSDADLTRRLNLLEPANI